MKDLRQLLLFLLLSTFFSCGKTEESSLASDESEVLNPKVDVKELQSDFMKWWVYHSNTILLSSDFKGIDENSQPIQKKSFLEKLTTGKHIPIRLASDNGFETYKLHPLPSSSYEIIGSTMANEASTSLKNFNMEGKQFPDFDFKDLVGNQYTRETTQGKILILKTWFIACKACIEEFPELNEFVKKYSNQEDLIFLSLALDSPTELKDFLKTREFAYQVVPNQKEFIMGKLDLQIYPSHLIIGPNGEILKVVTKASEMIRFVEELKPLGQ